MASASPIYGKSGALQSANQVFPLDTGLACHTEICWIPTSSRGWSRVSLFSTQSSITSRTRFISVSKVLAWDEALAVTPAEARRTVAVMEAATRSIANGGVQLEVDI